MKVIYGGGDEGHDPAFFLVRGQVQTSTEQPERAQILLEAAKRAGLEQEAPAAAALGPIAAVHTPEYLDFLAKAYEDWQALPNAGKEIIPNIHPAREHAGYPRAIVGRAGYHQADTACPIGPKTYEAALASAARALHAADRLLDGEDGVYALCRPPGHHAYADMAGGFCFLNNAAIAAQSLLSDGGGVAILDVDVHAGNGTQGIFYRRSDVLTVSIHADPADYYPYFWGHAEERGVADGEGYNLNLPLPVGSGDDAFLAALETACRRIGQFAPDYLVVALGLDAHEDDPLHGMTVTTPGFSAIAKRVAQMAIPTLLVQEGGYLSPVLGENLEAFLAGFQEGRA